MSVNTACKWCQRDLTPEQVARGNKCCSQACGHRLVRSRGTQQRNYLRQARKATVRVIYWLNDDPVQIEEQPLPDDERWVQGPGRIKDVTVHVFDDGHEELRCLWCDNVTVNGWCGSCAALISLEPKPERKSAAPRIEPVPPQGACALCGTAIQSKRKHCSPECATEYHARAARERYRARVGLPATWDRPRKPHAV